MAEFEEEYEDIDIESLVPQTREIDFNDVFQPLFESDLDQKRYFQCYGGRGSGKSWVAACMAVLMACGDLDKDKHRILYLRQNMTTSEDSTMADVEAAMIWLGKAGQFSKRAGTLTHKVSGSTISFKGINSTGSAKLKSLSGVTTVIFEEAEEIKTFDDFSKIDESIRVKGKPLKIVMVYNPTSAVESWIHKEWFIEGQPNPQRYHDTVFMHSTFKDNEDTLNKSVVQRYKDLEFTNPTYYRNVILAEWTLEVDNRMYEGWTEYDYFDEPQENLDIAYGLDFSYGGKDHTSMVKVRFFEGRYYVEDLFSFKAQRISDTVRYMREAGVPKSAKIFADSAMPLLIEEIRKEGWKQIRKASKGNVEAGIKKIQNKDIVLVGGQKDDQQTQLYFGYYTFRRNPDTGKLPHEPDSLAAMRYAINSKEYVDKKESRKRKRKKTKSTAVKSKGFI